MSLVDDVQSRIKKCKASKDQAEKDLVRFTERKDAALERLKTEFGVESVEEGKAKLEEIQKEIEAGKVELGEVKGILDDIMSVSESGD